MEIEEYIIADDGRLVEMVLEGDRFAFDHLFQRHSEGIRRLFVSRMGSVEDVDDLLQETFLKAYINLHRYSDRYTFGQWLYVIARNTHIDFYRRRNDDLSIDDRFSTPEDHAPNPEQSVINRQNMGQIERCIEMLGERQRTLFRLRFLEGYSYEEIAAHMQMPLGSVKTNIHRARANMCRLILGDS
ncbi:MAG: RNA polymerase sigma factor [Rikenellaceae bacterium]